MVCDLQVSQCAPLFPLHPTPWVRLWTRFFSWPVLYHGQTQTVSINGAHPHCHLIGRGCSVTQKHHRKPCFVFITCYVQSWVGTDPLCCSWFYATCMIWWSSEKISYGILLALHYIIWPLLYDTWVFRPTTAKQFHQTSPYLKANIPQLPCLKPNSQTVPAHQPAKNKRE